MTLLHRVLDDVLGAFAAFLAWEMTRLEVYGLFFLLGSFVVASLSDLKHLSAQREFMDVWFAFVGLLFAVQVAAAGFDLDAAFYAKWVLILLFSILSHAKVGLWLRLATADVAACAAAASLLPTAFVLAFYLILKGLHYPASRLLARKRDAYPFLPVVTVATLVFVVLAFLGGVVEL